MTNQDYKLDNPVWHSLNETHRIFAVQFEDAKFYHPDYCPFGGFVSTEKSMESVNKYAELSDNFYVVGDKPAFGNHLKLSKELVCYQMLLDTPIAIDITERIVELRTEHSNALFKLVNAFQPGYFKNKTSELGSYYGIYKNGELVAVTGERMKMNVYSEVSAVVTHPNYLGNGYAKQLITHTTNKIFGENKIPYLHVGATNIAAIKLYEILKFKTRRQISFWNLIKVGRGL